jgi:hypothetical protein
MCAVYVVRLMLQKWSQGSVNLSVPSVADAFFLIATK